jgi:hypothetical protein
MTAYQPRHCSRCGAEVPAMLDLSSIATGARRDLEGMRLALPSSVTVGLRTIDRALRCVTGQCSPEDRR